MKTNYVYGSGMRGYMFDFGPEHTEDSSKESLNEAVESLISVFSDSISEEEISLMRENLTNNGWHSFKDPLEAGAEYAQISEESF